MNSLVLSALIYGVVVCSHFQPRFRGNPSGVVGPPSRFNNNNSNYNNNPNALSSSSGGGQYPQMSRPRGPSEDLSLTESGHPASLQPNTSSVSRAPVYKLNSEVETQHQHQQHFDVGVTDRRPNGSGDASEEYGRGGASAVVSSSPGSKRKMLYDPKSSQFVDPTPQTSDRWERVPRRPPAVNIANEQHSVPAGESESKFAPTLLRKPITPKSEALGGAAVSRELSGNATAAAAAPAASSIMDAEAIAQAKADADKAERQKERQSRGPRTKGQLYRYNSEGEIERVLSELEEAVQEAAKKRAKEERRAEAAAAAAAAAAASSTAAVDEEDGEDRRRGNKREPREPREPREVKEPRVKKERKPLSKKDTNYDVFPSAEETRASGSGFDADEIQKIASGTADPLSLSYISGLGSMQLEDDTRGSKLASWSSPVRSAAPAPGAGTTAPANDSSSAASRSQYWGGGGSGLQMLQPQQNPNAELDHSLSLGELDGILGSLSGNGNEQSW